MIKNRSHKLLDFVFAFAFVFNYIYRYIYCVCMCVCKYVYIYIYIFTLLKSSACYSMTCSGRHKVSSLNSATHLISSRSNPIWMQS